MIGFFLFVLGSSIGSFLNVLILRSPKGKSINFPPSFCPKCKKSLKWYHNIPLLSWLFLKGKCAFCNCDISLQYPLIELFSGLLFLYFGLEYLGVKGVLIGLLFSMLLALSLIDLRYKAVPDLLSLPTLIVALLINFSIASLMDALIFAGAFALLKIFISAIKKEEVMGEADIIIAAIIGASAGKILGFSAIYIGAVAALVAFLIKKEKTLPFIPFLSIGLFISFIFHEKISSFLGGYFG